MQNIVAQVFIYAGNSDCCLRCRTWRLWKRHNLFYDTRFSPNYLFGSGVDNSFKSMDIPTPMSSGVLSAPNTNEICIVGVKRQHNRY